MASDSDVAASLRVLAEAADSEIATHDLNTLADALDSSVPTTQDEILEWCHDNLGNASAHIVRNATHPTAGNDGVYVNDLYREEFVEQSPDGWKLVDKKGKEHSGVWWNFPVYDP